MINPNALLWIAIIVLLALVAYLAWRLWQSSRAGTREGHGDTAGLPEAGTASNRAPQLRRSSAPPPAWAGNQADAPAAEQVPTTGARNTSAGQGPSARNPSARNPGAPASPQPYGRTPPRTTKPPPALAGDIPGVTPRAPHGTPRPRASAPPAASAGGQRGESDKPDPEPASAQRARSTAPAALLAAAKTWGYQLQRLDFTKAAASPFELLVTDYSRDGSGEEALKPAELARLKRMPDGGRRLVYAYISVGEAESYRYYWRPEWKKKKPAWIIGENPDWNENYFVRFWAPEWREILFGGPESYIDRIAAQGFDGLYLDRCDVYEDIADKKPKVARERADIEAEMVGFIGEISRYVRSRHPGMGIIMQNAELLLAHGDVRRAIDAMAKEELLYGLDSPQQPNSQEAIEESQQALVRALKDGKAVFVVEYLDKGDLRYVATERIREINFVPYMSRANRELDTLETQQPESAIA